MRKKLINALIRIGVLLAVYIVTMIITASIVNKGNDDMTADMRKATLPVIYANVNDEYVNCLHGYVSEMDGSYLRGTITPMSQERTIPVKIMTFDSIVTSIDYEVRSLDMQRLLENANLGNFEYVNNEIYATIPVKDLIEEEQEYMLIIKLSLSDGRIAKYYCRFIDKAELYLNEKIEFIYNFSRSTFDKERARELVPYMESNSEGDNSSYGYVNIHSSFNQLSWGDLEPTLESERQLRILDIDTQDARMKFNYRVAAKGENYDVEEYFHLVRGVDRIYLIDYERTMNQVFDEDKTVVLKGKIFHGILADPVEYKENEDANVFSFVQDHRLYSYNSDTNSLARVYSFWDKENDDVRTTYEANNIKILYVDNIGNMHFATYGYMDRGIHEGEVGIAVYYFDSVFNTIEEKMFIPYSKSYEILKHDVESLCYVNHRNNLYLMFNGTIYNINLESKKAELLASGLNETRFVSSDDNSMIAWQPADNVYEYTTLKFMSLNAMVPVEINASPNHILIPIGFFNKDFVYGSVNISDIMLDSTGRTVLPMDYIYIQNLSGDILKTYHNDGYYVTEVEFRDNMLNMKRIVMNKEVNTYYQADEDQIMNKEDKEGTQNVYKSVVTDEMETTWQTVLKKASKSENLRILTPREVLYEGNKYFYLNVKDVLDRFYVYDKGEIAAIYTDAADAVYTASSLDGTVVSKNSKYIWRSGDRKPKALIEGIETVRVHSSYVPEVEESDEDTDNEPVEEIEEYEYVSMDKTTVSVCLDEMLKTAGVYVDAAALLKSGKSALEIMRDNLETGYALELSGCSTNAMLYYVSNGSPVMAVVEGDEAVLIIGYDDYSLTLYNPAEGKISKKSIKDSSVWFANNRNRFLTYVK